jgi:hypothetical protein
MKTLSIKQPWLYCITDLDKRIENRKKAQRVDVSETAVESETTIAGVVVRPSRLIQPGTLFVIWEGA